VNQLRIPVNLLSVISLEEIMLLHKSVFADLLDLLSSGRMFVHRGLQDWDLYDKFS